MKVLCLLVGHFWVYTGGLTTPSERYCSHCGRQEHLGDPAWKVEP